MSGWIIECKSVEINEQESLQLDGCPVDRMITRIDDLRTEFAALFAERQVSRVVAAAGG